MGAWGTLCSLFVLQSKSPGPYWQMVSTTALEDLNVAVFDSGNWNIHGKGYTILGCFADPKRSFIRHQQGKAMGLPNNAPHPSWLSYPAFCTICSTGRTPCRPRKPTILECFHSFIIKGDQGGFPSDIGMQARHSTLQRTNCWWSTWWTARRECGQVFFRRSGMNGLDGCWPFATSIGKGCIPSRCPQLGDGMCCPCVEFEPKLATRSSSTRKTRHLASLRLSPAHKVQHCTCVPVLKSFYSNGRLRKPPWPTNWFYRKSRLFQNHYSSGIGIYSRQMLIGVKNIGCTTTSTWYLRNYSYCMPLPLQTRLVCPLSKTMRKMMQWMSRKK